MASPSEWAQKGKTRRVTRWTEPVMHQQTKPVTDFAEDLRQLAADMFATMEAADGVGLAGPQVDESLAIFVFNCPDETGKMHSGVVCNPKITLP